MRAKLVSVISMSLHRLAPRKGLAGRMSPRGGLARRAVGGKLQQQELRLHELSLQQFEALQPGQLTDEDVVCVDMLAASGGGDAFGTADLATHVRGLMDHFEPQALARHMPQVKVPLFEHRCEDGEVRGRLEIPLPLMLSSLGQEPLQDKSGGYAVVHWADDLGSLSLGVRQGQGDCIVYNEDWVELMRQAAGPIQEPLQQILRRSNVDAAGRRPARPNEIIHGLVLSQGYSSGAAAHRHGANVFLQLHGITEWWLLSSHEAETMMGHEPEWLPGGRVQWDPDHAAAMTPQSLRNHGGVVGRDDVNLLSVVMRPGMMLRIGRDVVHLTHKHWGYNAALTWVTRLQERSA